MLTILKLLLCGIVMVSLMPSLLITETLTVNAMTCSLTESEVKHAKRFCYIWHIVVHLLAVCSACTSQVKVHRLGGYAPQTPLSNDQKQGSSGEEPWQNQGAGSRA